MSRHDDESAHTRLARLVYRELLRETRQVADRSQQRWRALRRRFPDLPDPQPAARAGVLCDRRRGLRVVTSGGAVVRLAGAGDEVVAEVADRSAGGLSLWLDRPLDAGAVLLLRLTQGGREEWLRAEVRYCRPRPRGGWAAGCLVLGGAGVASPAG